MTPRALLELLTGRKDSRVIVRQRGSHVIAQCGECGECRTVIPMHCRDLAPRTWADIEASLMPCLGERWSE